MADAEKVISFRGQDSGFTSTIDKLRDSQKRANQEMLQDALKQGKSVKDVNNLLEEQIRLLKTKAELQQTPL